MRFKGKVAIVTGGAGSIGKATVQRLAQEGARVLVADLSPQGEQVTATLAAQGLEVAYRHVDVSDDAQVAAMVQDAVKRFGRLDVMVANAGIAGIGTADTVDLASWNRVIAVNLTSIMLCTRHAVPAMRAAGGGAIVNVASIMGTVGTRGAVPYGAAKGGVVNLTRCSAMDCAPESIRVNAICPGYLEDAVSLGDTTARTRNMAELIAKHPLGRLARTSEVAAAIAFLASDDASFVTGACLMVDGGYTAQ
ncbi:MAG: SDR family NAD(P)-dependent oxidoreductase [Steroidobacteraceae bacterium]